MQINLLYEKWKLNVNFPNCITKEISDYFENDYLIGKLNEYDYIDASFKLGDIFLQSLP